MYHTYSIVNNIINRKRLSFIKEQYHGERCFILGNGPSLNKQDLILLNNEYTFVTNRFILHKDFDEISPNIYCISDNHFIDNKEDGQPILKKILNKVSLNNFRLFFPLQWKIKASIKQIKLPANSNYKLFKTWEKIWEKKTFSYDIPNGVSWGHTIIIDFCLPLAMYMGFKEIYLLGCDMSYEKVTNKTHFYENVEIAKQKAGNDSRKLWNKLVTDSYSIINKTATKNGLKIYNATQNGYLEVFPRVNFENLF